MVKWLAQIFIKNHHGTRSIAQAILCSYQALHSHLWANIRSLTHSARHHVAADNQILTNSGVFPAHPLNPYSWKYGICRISNGIQRIFFNNNSNLRVRFCFSTTPGELSHAIYQRYFLKLKQVSMQCCKLISEWRQQNPSSNCQYYNSFIIINDRTHAYMYFKHVNKRTVNEFFRRKNDTKTRPNENS